jgi:hypothetical protein
MTRFVLLFVVFVFVQACKSSSVVQVAQEKQVDTIRVVSVPDSVQQLIPEPIVATEQDSKESVEDLAFTYLKAKSRVAWTSGNNTESFG